MKDRNRHYISQACVMSSSPRVAQVGAGVGADGGAPLFLRQTGLNTGMSHAVRPRAWRKKLPLSALTSSDVTCSIEPTLHVKTFSWSSHFPENSRVKINFS